MMIAAGILLLPGARGEAAVAGGDPVVPAWAPLADFDRNPKLQSQLSELAAVEDVRGEAAAREFAAGRGIELEGGKVTVVIESSGGPEGAELAAILKGATIEATYRDLVQAAVPLEALDELAASPFVSYVRNPLRPVPLSVTSEGVADVSADAWHANGIDGDGVKLAVTDLGFTGYQDEIAAGELPAGVIVQSFSGDITGGGTTHGTNCAEIAYDMAPGAQLYIMNFATEVELGNMIDYIIAEDIDVVSASWAVPVNYRGDGEGVVNDMVTTAHDAGVFWVNAAGNSAQNHWSGTFSDTNTDGWHEYTPGDATNSFSAGAGELLAIYLNWNDWPTTDQDYDLYLYKDGVGTPVAVSNNLQTGTQTPYESIYFVVPPGWDGTYHLTIYRSSADGTADFQLFCHFGVLEYQVAAQSISGQPADSDDVMTVGAVLVDTTSLMYYSSQGPTTDGRVKPDIAGPTHVTTGLAGPYGFGGTSGATPHVAGSAALLKEAMPAYGPDQLKSQLETWAEDLGDPGKDSVYGSGKLDLGACTEPLLSIGSPVALWASYSDYAARELTVTWSIANSGGFDAYDASVVGSVNTNGVKLLTGMPVAAGDIAAGAGAVEVTLRYSVPMGVAGFLSTTYATADDTCGTTYYYPATLPS